MNVVKSISFLSVAILIVSPAFAQNITKSTIDDQKKIEVTVYNSNIALVKDTRQLKLLNGEGELRFMDVAAHIMPVTVHVKSLADPFKFAVLEQNYEYDLMDHNKLLDKFIGKDIKLERYNSYTDKTEVKKAKLLSNNSHQPVYEMDGEIYLGLAGTRILPSIPENLIAKPTLTWMYANENKKVQDIEVSYLTNSMNWKADYVLVLGKEDKKADLSGWVTIDNKSGAIYEDAVLKLVAGNINRVQNQRVKFNDGVRITKLRNMNAVQEQFTEESFFEYHIYDLQRPTTLKNNQTKQISLLSASDVDIKKELLVFSAQNYYTRQYSEKIPKQPVNVYVKFKNAKENNLGMPLPKGVVRLYKKDSKDKLQFIGEDRIEHTPKNEEISLRVGEAFDVVVERRQTDYQKITRHIYETEWEIKVRNHKEEGIVVGLIEPMPGDWDVLEKSHEYVKKDAFTARFNVSVKPDEEAVVTYRLRVTY